MLAATVAAAIALATGASIPAAPTRWVEDHAGFLSPAARDQLDRELAGYERATGHQVVVWIGTTLDGAPLDDWANRTFAAWQVGRKDHDDGLAMFILAEDRTVAIEVGYGLEGRVTDLVATHVIRDVMAPALRAGDRDRAVLDGVATLLEAIEGQPWTGARPGPAAVQAEPSTGQLVLGGLVVLALIVLAVRHPRLALFALWALMRGRGGPGGDGGFGGGGGRSGGGGGRGSW